MAELRRIIWSWETILERLSTIEPGLARSVSDSCRPLEAERLADGRLVLVVGCWLPDKLHELSEPRRADSLAGALGRLLEDKVGLVLTPWPGGQVGAPEKPPDLLAGLSSEDREQATSLESSLHRHFFASGRRRNVPFTTGHAVLEYRLDLAIVPARIGVEIGGWTWKERTRPEAVSRRQREYSLGAEGWRVLWFTGAEVLKDVEGCLNLVEAAYRRPTREQSYPRHGR